MNAWKASGEEVPKLSNKVAATIQKIKEDEKIELNIGDNKLEELSYEIERS